MRRYDFVEQEVTVQDKECHCRQQTRQPISFMKDYVLETKQKCKERKTPTK